MQQRSLLQILLLAHLAKLTWIWYISWDSGPAQAHLTRLHVTPFRTVSHPIPPPSRQTDSGTMPKWPEPSFSNGLQSPKPYTKQEPVNHHPANRTHNPQLHTRSATWKTTGMYFFTSNACNYPPRPQSYNHTLQTGYLTHTPSYTLPKKTYQEHPHTAPTTFDTPSNKPR